jgi:hypothetical protein
MPTCWNDSVSAWRRCGSRSRVMPSPLARPSAVGFAGHGFFLILGCARLGRPEVFRFRVEAFQGAHLPRLDAPKILASWQKIAPTAPKVCNYNGLLRAHPRAHGRFHAPVKKPLCRNALGAVGASFGHTANIFRRPPNRQDRRAIPALHASGQSATAGWQAEGTGCRADSHFSRTYSPTDP